MHFLFRRMHVCLCMCVFASLKKFTYAEYFQNYRDRLGWHPYCNPFEDSNDLRWHEAVPR